MMVIFWLKGALLALPTWGGSLPLESIGTALTGITIGAVGTYEFINSSSKTDEITKIIQIKYKCL